MEVGTFCQINDYMTIYDNPMSGHSLTLVQDSTFSNFSSSKPPGYWSQISYGASMGCWEWNVVQMFRVKNGQDGFRAHICKKNTSKSPFSEPRGRWHRNLIYSIGYSSTFKFVQMMTLGWPWLFLWPLNLFLNASAWVKAYTAYIHVSPSLF